MASTVNGVSSITTAAQRETTGVIAHRFKHPWGDVGNGEILRARIFLDSASRFVIDNPTVANTNMDGSASTLQRIFPVGIEFTNDIATVITFDSKVGAAAAKTLSKFKIGANQGLFLPVRNAHVFSPTDPGGVLGITSSLSTGSNPLELLLHYVIADSAVLT